MVQINYKELSKMAIVLCFLTLLLILALSTGCITAAKSAGKQILATPTPTPTPPPTPTPEPTPTPRLTPVALPTAIVRPVDPYLSGERWEGQWFKFYRSNVLGKQDMHVGYIVYDHAWLDKITWYNNAMGNYYTIEPSAGNRYFVVWLHEEMFGDNQTSDPRLWSFDQEHFRLQVKDKIYKNGVSAPGNRIKELEEKSNYYNIERTRAYGYKMVFTHHAPESGGWEAQLDPYLRMGEGNAIDGYLIYEVPTAMNSDVVFLGNFAHLGSAYWRFLDV